MTASPANVRGGGTGLVFAPTEPAEPLDTIARVTEAAIAAHPTARSAILLPCGVARLTTDVARAIRVAFTMATPEITRSSSWRRRVLTSEAERPP
jgi:hypothetical protein